MFIGCRKTVLGDPTDRCLPILSLSLRFSVEIDLPIFHAYVRMENVSRRRRREAKKRGVRKSVSVGVCSNALATRSRLSKRTESHSREHLWSLPASLLFFFTLLRLPLSLSPSLSLPRLRSRWPSVLLLTCSLTYGSSADRWGSTGRFKGISTIFDSGFHTPGWTRSLPSGRSENYDASPTPLYRNTPSDVRK